MSQTDPTASTTHAPRIERTWLAWGAFFCGTAVVCGAFAAHGLGPRMLELYGDVTKEIAGETIPGPLKYLADFKTAAEYQMTHGLALLFLGLLSSQRRTRWVAIAGWSFVIGVLLFSGSLYVLVLTGLTKLGMITPIGGMAFLVGWVALLIDLLLGPPRQTPGSSRAD
ncbi:MAG: DUF423 domain-containing protein [Planctomycetaceae bacterium]|nr:DUF423 domain-containing protein [Planctomycetaceae bacterium]